ESLPTNPTRAPRRFRMQSWNERKRLGAAGVLVALALARTASADVAVTAKKLIVIDRGERGAKAVFITPDPAVDKGSGTDMTAIGVTLDVTYDNGVDPAITGEFEAPLGSPNWRSNLAKSAQYVNLLAPADGSVRTLALVAGSGAKLVAKSPGDVLLA